MKLQDDTPKPQNGALLLEVGLTLTKSLPRTIVIAAKASSIPFSAQESRHLGSLSLSLSAQSLTHTHSYPRSSLPASPALLMLLFLPPPF